MSARARGAIVALLALVVARLWIMPMGSSFAMDETGTFWNVKDGFPVMLERYRQWPSISAFYGAIASAAYALGGAREYVLRLPSLVFALLALFLLYRLSRRLLGPDSALAAVVVFACLDRVIYAAGDARPYALVLAASAASTLALVAWLDSGRWWNAALYGMTAGLVIHAQYLAGVILLVHALYLRARFAEESKARTGQVVLAGAIFAALAAPLVPALRALGGNPAAHSYAPRPSAGDLAWQLLPPLPLALGAVSIWLAWAACRRLKWAPAAIPHSTVILMVGTLLIPTILFFEAAYFTTARIFLPHYLIATSLGFALLAGWAIGAIQPAKGRAVAVAGIAALSFVALSPFDRLWPAHSWEDWRGAMAAVREAAGSERLTTVFVSPFIESATEFRPESGHGFPEFLLSPLAAYPAPGRVIPVARIFDDAERGYLESTVAPQVAAEGRFVLVKYAGHPPDEAWFVGRFPNYSVKRLGDFGGVRAILFEKDR